MKFSIGKIAYKPVLIKDIERERISIYMRFSPTIFGWSIFDKTLTSFSDIWRSFAFKSNIFISLIIHINPSSFLLYKTALPKAPFPTIRIFS